MGKLTDLKVRNAKPGIHGDGAGLYLKVKPSGARSWFLRVQFQGHRQDVGLGGYPADRSLAEAREDAARLRKLARRGHDPKAERDKEKIIVPNFEKAARAAHEELSKGWTDRTAFAFLSGLERHAFPDLGKKRVDHVEREHVIAVLSPIWAKKPQAAKKVRQWITTVLDFAHARRWRLQPAPTAKEVTRTLSKQPASKGFAAMPYNELPSYYAEQWGKDDSPARLALLFTILTGARSGEVRKAQWGEIDRENRIWTRPASHMKARKEHVVMLSDAALAVLDRARAAFGKSGLIFPSVQGKTLSDAALGKLLRDSGRSETVHGFRSTFRTWAAETLRTMPVDVFELALAHSVGGDVERRYNRAQLYEMRQELADAWGRFVTSGMDGAKGNVVRLAASER